jgi:cyclic pyranopterin phosphate synthase
MNTPLLDRFGRLHDSLRISVTDRCNIRCFYCMPNENLQFRPREELLTFEEIERFVRIVARAGVTKVRLTGGEPLVRAELAELVRLLRPVPGLRDIALTTNGILLGAQAVGLRQAGLDRINVSLDTLNEEVFERIARRTGLQRVLDGIFAAREAGFARIRLNAIAIAGLTEAEVVPLVSFSRQHDFELRFIEFMPLDAEDNWEASRVLSGAKIRTIIEAEFGPLRGTSRPDRSQPAVDFVFADGRGRIGFINPVSEPFCQDCNRLRLTAEGQIRNCLFSAVEWDARQVMREGGSDADLDRLIRDCVAHKMPGHGIDNPDFVRPSRAMYQIGG